MSMEVIEWSAPLTQVVWQVAVSVGGLTLLALAATAVMPRRAEVAASTEREVE